MSANGTNGDPLGKILVAIGMVREEIAALREDLMGKKTAPAPVASAQRVSAAAGQGAPTDELRPILLKGSRYLVNLATGHAYHREADGSQGAWAGLFHKSGSKGPWINTSVPSPVEIINAEGGKRKSTRKHKRRHGKTRKH